MKQLSKEVDKVRSENKNFFILEKYGNETKESFLSTLAIVKEHAEKANIPLNEYLSVLSQISVPSVDL